MNTIVPKVPATIRGMHEECMYETDRDDTIVEESSALAMEVDLQGSTAQTLGCSDRCICRCSDLSVVIVTSLKLDD